MQGVMQKNPARVREGVKRCARGMARVGEGAREAGRGSERVQLADMAQVKRG